VEYRTFYDYNPGTAGSAQIAEPPLQKLATMCFRRKNIRFNAVNYRGRAWFFITLCCELRRPVFANDKWALRAIDCLKKTSDRYHFSVHAFCVMPDHFHALVEGVAPDSDLLLFVRNFKQATSREYSRESGAPLWQKKFYDHILRPKDSPGGVAWYIWMNPVRKGHCSQPDQYPHSGSFTGQWKHMSQPQNQWMPTWKKIVSAGRL
jgi:putative transposase